MKVTRREALGLMAAASAALPYTHAVAASEELGTQTLLDQLEQQVALAIEVCGRDASDAQSVARQLFQSYAIPRGPLALRKTSFGDGKDGESFAWCVSPQAYGLKVWVVGDDDPRRSVRGYAPVRISELTPVLRGMLRCHHDRNELDAAQVFDAGCVYDPSIGGDGVAMLSNEHPVDGGSSWANLIRVPNGTLSPKSLRMAFAAIRQFTDDRGLRLLVRPTRLLVPANLLADGTGAMVSLKQEGELPPTMLEHPVCWDFLRNRHAWFIVTDVTGFYRVIKAPLEIGFGVDVDTSSVFVATYERRAYACVDPRAVLGVVPDDHLS